MSDHHSSAFTIIYKQPLYLVGESQIGKVSRRDSAKPLDEDVVEKWLDVFDSDDI